MEPGISGHKNLSGSKLLPLALFMDALLIVVSLAGFYQVWHKTALPFPVSAKGGVLIAGGDFHAAGINRGDTLSAVNNHVLSALEQLEVLLDTTPPLEPLLLTIQSGAAVHTVAVTPLRFYSFFYMCVAGVTGFFFMWLALTLLLKAEGRRIALTSHYMLFLTGVIMLTTWGNITVLPFWLSLLIRLAFTIAYTIAPVCFFHLCLLFPKERARHLVRRGLPGMLYPAALLLGLYSTATFTRVMHSPAAAAPAAMMQYLASFDAVRLFLAVLVLLAIVSVAAGYSRLQLLTEKKKARWLLTGFVAGPGSFALLWVLPQAVTDRGLVPEEVILLLLAVVPVCFAIAILSYRLFDIDLIIRRGFVYTLALMAVSAAYILITVVVPLAVTGLDRSTLSLGTMLLAAAAFAPVRDRVHRFVDQRFFRVQYDFRIAVNAMLARVRASRSKEEVATATLAFIDEFLPVTASVFALYDPVRRLCTVTGARGVPLREGRQFQMVLTIPVHGPMLLPGSSEPEAKAEPLRHRVFRRNGIHAVIPFTGADGEAQGMLLLGGKRSGQMYFYDDIELLKAAGQEVAAALSSIRLLDDLVAEQLRAAELAELSRMKSYFVSLVSHELKTPLTSIKLFTELLGADAAVGPRDEYRAIVLGETERLARLIDNILDLSRIERGIKEYSFKDEDIAGMLRHALELLEYQRKLFNAEFVVTGLPEHYTARADADALVRVFINLISNGLKYAAEPKRITISAACGPEGIHLVFSNLACGLTERDLERLGTPYFRAGSVLSGIDGTGLGLSLTGPAVEAHGGTFTIAGEQREAGVMEVRFTVFLRKQHAENTVN